MLKGTIGSKGNSRAAGTLGVFSPLLVLLVHGSLYNEIGRIAAWRGVNYGPQVMIPLDAQVPFVPLFVLPYLFVWVFPILLIGYVALKLRFDPSPCLRISIGLVALMLSCYVLWILFPVRCDLRLDEAVLARHGFLGNLVRINYEAASQWNACPSFHVAGPWFLYRAVRDAVPKMPRLFLFIVVAIAASTVLIRIHFLADIACGVLIGELIYHVVRKRVGSGNGRVHQFPTRPALALRPRRASPPRQDRFHAGVLRDHLPAQGRLFRPHQIPPLLEP